MSKGNLNAFRKVAFWEGISYLILLPLSMWKILLSGPKLPVTIMGNIHGFLFILFLVFMFLTGKKYKWDLSMYIICIIASVIPFGTFILDSKFLKPLSNK